jgi:hypothetical protein
MAGLAQGSTHPTLMTQFAFRRTIAAWLSLLRFSKLSISGTADALVEIPRMRRRHFLDDPFVTADLTWTL